MSAPASAFAPLRNRAFLLMWTANVLSNTGGWMQTTGAAWEMTTLTTEPIFVALLSAASTLPMFLFGFFAGVLADRFDRRRYIIVCQFWMMAVAATLAVLAFTGHLTHWNLVGLCLCMGLGNAMNGPAWQAVVPEVVPAHDLRPAIALNSAGFNLARMVGPVLGQLLLGLVGVFLLFTINTFAFVGVILAMLAWRRPAEAQAAQRREAFGVAIVAGIRFVQNSGDLQSVLLRGLCFSVPAIAFGTLLPVIGRFELGLDEFRFGVLYAVFGAGAVAGAAIMSTVNRLLGPDRANIWAMGICGAVTLVSALVMTPWVVGFAAAVNGACWITVGANNNTASQTILPNFMRARGMAVHQMVFFGGIALGSLLWGKVATFFGVPVALIAASLSLVPLTIVAASLRLPGSSTHRA